MKKYKRIISIMFMLCLCLLCASCGETGEAPSLESVPVPYKLDGNTISVTSVNENIIYPYRDITCKNGKVAIYSDSSREEYFEGDGFELEEGKRSFVLVVYNKYGETEYAFNTELILIDGITVKYTGNETCGMGSALDKNDITVIAHRKNGEELITDSYAVNYDFSVAGEREVTVEYGGYADSFFVEVVGEYIPSLGADFKDGRGVMFALDGGEAVLTDGTDVLGFYAVPPSVIYGGNEYKLTGIAERAFSGNMFLTSVSVPDGIDIGGFCFEGCACLSDAVLGDFCTPGDYMFYGCGLLENVKLPETLKELPDGMFAYCDSLMKITIPDSVERIGLQTFLRCDSLWSAVLPENLYEISARAFGGCTALREVLCNASLEYIGDYAFTGCSSMTVFVSPAGLKTIGAGAFDGCDKIKIYSAENKRGHIFAFQNDIPFETSKENTIILLIKRPNTPSETIDLGDVYAVLYTDGKIERIYGFSYECDLSHPGTHTMTLSTVEISASYNVNVSYTVNASGGTDANGCIYRTEGENAVLVFMPDDYKGEYVLPLIIDFDGERFNVTGVGEGVFAGKEGLTSVYLHEKTLYISAGAISDNSSVNTVYIDTPKGKKLKIENGNLQGLSDDLKIYCTLYNSIIHVCFKSSAYPLRR